MSTSTRKHRSTPLPPPPPPSPPRHPKRIPRTLITITYCCSCRSPAGALDVDCVSCTHRLCKDCIVIDEETVHFDLMDADTQQGSHEDYDKHATQKTQEQPMPTQRQSQLSNDQRNDDLTMDTIREDGETHESSARQTMNLEETRVLSAVRQCNPLVLQEPKKRKLNMFKYENCRRDKKKCERMNRSWPTKCNRCIEKKIPCSEGTRVVRSSKAASGSSSSPLNDVLVAGDTGSLDERLTQWVFLSGYHKIMMMAKKVLHSLKEDMTVDFHGMGPTIQNIDRTTHSDFVHFIHEVLEPTMRKSANPLLVIGASTQHSSSSLLAVIVAQGFDFKSTGSLCPVCDTTDQQPILDVFGPCHDVCGEFLAREHRIKKHHELSQAINHPGSTEALTEEYARYFMLALEVLRQAGAVFKSLGLSKAAVHQSQHIGPFYSHIMLEGLPMYSGRVQDCLGRTYAHRCLDAFSRMDVMPDQDLQLFLNTLGSNLDHQDILGRTLLHIACQMNWAEGVQKLLALGAKPELATLYGSLPIHYAAALGSLDVCRSLLAYKTRFDASAKDCSGETAFSYAVTHERWGIQRLLKAHHVYLN